MTRVDVHWIHARVRIHLASAVVAGLAFVAAFFACGGANAQDLPTLEGRWAAGPLTTRWVIGDWGSACGPKPSGGGEAATAVLIKLTGGELVITGGGRTYATTQCWEQYPGIQRVSHTSSPRSWKSACRTQQGDPRQASLSTSLTATDSSISFYEAGQYQFVIQGQNCTASVGRYRTYTLTQRAGTVETPAASASAAKAAPTPAPRPEPREPPSDRCQKTGPPARLEVRPARKLLKGGDEFTFRAVVSDASGCLLYVTPTWSIESGGEHVELDPNGTVRVKSDAPEGEVRLTASVGGRSAAVGIEVASAARYEALLQSGAFNGAGEVDEAASVAIASQAIGTASGIAEDRASSRKKVFVGIVAIVAAALAVVGLLLARRGRKSPKVDTPKGARPSAALGSTLPVSDAPRREPPGDAPLIKQVSPPAATPPARAAAPGASSQPSKTICPVCGTQYPAESRFCGKDGATLLPLN